MSNEPLGLVAEAQRRRSVFARFIGAATPVPYERPAEPKPDHAAAELQQANARLIEENDRLRAMLRLAPAADRLLKGESITRTAVDMRDVMQTFCDVMTAAGERIDGGIWTIERLACRRRSRLYSWPRHVCIALVCQICPRPSLPMVAAQFGLLDHTSVMHACKKAPEHMRREPRLLAIHDKVLATFEVAK